MFFTVIPIGMQLPDIQFRFPNIRTGRTIETFLRSEMASLYSIMWNPAKPAEVPPRNDLRAGADRNTARLDKYTYNVLHFNELSRTSNGSQKYWPELTDSSQAFR